VILYALSYNYVSATSNDINHAALVWQGVGEVEPTAKLINATRTIWNFQKPVVGKCRGILFWWLGGNPDYECTTDHELVGTVA